MNLDGTSRVFLIAPKGRGKKTLISAIIHKCVNGVIKINNEILSILPIEKSCETAEASELIEQTIKSYHILEKFNIDNAFRGNLKGKDDFSVEVHVGDNFCGYLEFYNICNNQDGYTEELPAYQNFSSVLIILDAKKIMDGNNSDEGYIYNELDMAVKRYADDIYVQFAINNTDVFFSKEKTNDASALVTQAMELYSRSFDYCKRKNITFSVCPYTAANVNYYKVFDADGQVLENPDYAPWGIDDLMLSLMNGTSEVLDKRISKAISESKTMIKNRLGVFNKGNVRAFLDVRKARDDIGNLVIEHYPVLNAKKFFSKQQ